MELRENEQLLYGTSSLELMQAQPKQNLLSAWTVHLTERAYPVVPHLLLLKRSVL